MRSALSHQRVVALVAIVAFGELVARAQEDGIRLVAAIALQPETLRAPGRVVPKQRALAGSCVAGHIVAWGNDESGSPIDVGSRVRAQGELFRVDAGVYEAKHAAAKAALASAQARLADLEAGTRPERIAALEAALAEIDVRMETMRRDEARWRRLVEEDETAPKKRLEDVRSELAAADAQRKAAAAHLAEAKAGSTPTEIAVVEALVKEAAAQVTITEVDIRDTVVRAPFAGVVTRRNRNLGDYVSGAPFVEVLELVSDADLEIELKLPESALRDVVSGSTPVVLESPLLSESLTLPVDRTGGSIAIGEGVFVARIKVPPKKRGLLVPGAFVEGIIHLARSAGVVVPSGAVVVEGEVTVVFVARDGLLRRTPVAVGDRLSNGVIVSGAVRAGDQVAVGARSQLKDGAPSSRRSG